MVFKVKDGVSVNGVLAIDSAGKTDFSLLKSKPTTLAGYGITDAGAAAPVQSVAGKTGAVALVKADVGLANVDDTSDVNKPVSNATQTALNGKENSLGTGAVGTVLRHDKTWGALAKADVGLGNVDNTSDAAKPISSATQTALDAKINSSLIGAVNGVAGLDAGGKVPAAQLPAFVDDVIEVSAFTALPATGEAGKIYVTVDNGKTFRWGGTAYAEISASPGSTDAVPEGSVNLYHTAARAAAAAPVQSVAGKTGAVTLAKADVGLGNVDNTSDAAKPVSTATQTALDGKENSLPAGTVSQYLRGDKTMATLDKAAVGLANVDNTSDAAKPVSTAQQTAIDAKVNKAGDTMTGMLNARAGVSVGASDDVTDSAKKTTVATTAATSIFSFAKAAYRGAKFVVAVTEGTNCHIVELLIVHNGTAVYKTEYGEVTSGAALGTFDAVIDANGDVQVNIVAPNVTSRVVNVSATMLKL